jgi:hypothetical protein
MPLRQGNITAPVSAELIGSLKAAMSPERWHTYERAAGYNHERAHALYLWNASVGQSFHFPLQAVEVCMRNAIHKAFCNVYGPDWCNEATCRAAMQERQDREIAQAARRRLKMYGAAATTPQIVSSLTFGFWIAILRREYHEIIWKSHTPTVFPHLPAAITMKEVGGVGQTIKDLRNRIFHQEPLLGHDLSGQYAAILQMIEWICPETKQWVRRNTSVPQAIRSRP